MKCQRCGRALVRFTVEIPTKDGPVGWGPHCATFVTIKRSRDGKPFAAEARRDAPRSRPKLRRVDPMQPELPLELAS